MRNTAENHRAIHADVTLSAEEFSVACGLDVCVHCGVAFDAEHKRVIEREVRMVFAQCTDHEACNARTLSSDGGWLGTR